MDEDIRDALFDDDEEGNFETLDDDFVNQVCLESINCTDSGSRIYHFYILIGEQAMEEPAMEEGAAAEFDFDAHIKWLIEQR